MKEDASMLYPDLVMQDLSTALPDVDPALLSRIVSTLVRQGHIGEFVCDVEMIEELETLEDEPVQLELFDQESNDNHEE